MADISTIVLAAGYSSRMKGAFKPILKLGDCTVAEHAVRSHLAAGIQDVKVVVGYRADDVAAAVKDLGADIVRNPNFDRGMFSSVQAGVASLAPEIQAFFVQPVDIPLVEPSSIRTVLDYYRKNPCGIVYPVYKGRKGHPPLITSGYIPEIMASPAPDGLRGILKSHDADAGFVEVHDEAVLLDIDTLKDYHHLLFYKDRDNIPDQEQCMKLLDEACVPEDVKEHCQLVAVVACKLARLLNGKGVGLNENLVKASALLHDIKRHEKDHAMVGAMHLRACGFARVADIVSLHMDIESVESEPLTEAEILFLADKMVMGRRCVPLNERFDNALKRYEDNGKACLSIKRRKEQAEKIKKKMEVIIGCTLEEIPPVNMPRYEKEFREECTGASGKSGRCYRYGFMS
jgi:molybdenum cofactor cytidylyltransferase